MSEINEYCNLCGKNKDDCGELIPIPGGLKVCRNCMEKAMKMAEQLTGLTHNSDNIEKFVANFSPANGPSCNTSVLTHTVGISTK